MKLKKKHIYTFAEIDALNDYKVRNEPRRTIASHKCVICKLN